MSPGTNRRHLLTMICEVWRVPRSSVYAANGAAGVHRASARATRAEADDEGRRTGAGDSDGARRHAVPRRRLPEGPRAARAWRPGGQRQAGPPPSAPGPTAAGPPNGDPAHAGTIVTTGAERDVGHSAVPGRASRAVLAEPLRWLSSRVSSSLEGDDPGSSGGRRDQRSMRIQQRRLEKRHVAISVNDAPLADDSSGSNRPQEVDVEL
jgi:hypothetical protein